MEINEIVENLIAALPKELQDENKRLYRITNRVRNTIRSVLMEENLDYNEWKHVTGIDNTTWEDLFQAFIIKDGPHKEIKSQKTQYHYRNMLNAIAQIWIEKGWIDQSPKLVVSQKAPRNASITLSRFSQYLFSDYRKIDKAFIDEINGKRQGKLVPETLEEDFQAYLGLALILSGFCFNNPIARLKSLEWKHVPINPMWPIKFIRQKHHKREKKEKFCWFWLRPAAEALLQTARYRSGQTQPKGPIFSLDIDGLRNAVNALIEDLCKKNNLPIPTLSQICDLVQLHLRQFVTDLDLGVLSGKHDYRPVPFSQAISYTDNQIDNFLDIDPVEIGHTNVKESKINEEPERTLHEEFLLEDYQKILKDIESDLFDLFIMKNPDTRIKFLEGWVQNNTNKNTVPYHNLKLLILYILSLVPDRRKTPQTRGVYWNALKRIWRYFPHKRIEEISMEDLQSFIEESDLDPKTIKQSLNQWNAFGVFLRLNGIEMPIIQRKKLPVPSKPKTVRILTPGNAKVLAENLPDDSLRFTVFLAARVSLRISTICKLKVFDIFPGPLPIMYIHKAKGGKHRRVSLEYVTENEMKRLMEIITQKRPADFLVTDATGMPLNPKSVSEKVGKILKALFESDHTADIPLRFHSLRSYGLTQVFLITSDPRSSPMMAGHASPSTTISSYISVVDLEMKDKLEKWNTSLNQPNLLLPLAVIGAMIERTPRRVAQLVNEYNEMHSANPINAIEIGGRPGRPALYIHWLDMTQLINYCLSGENKSTS